MNNISIFFSHHSNRKVLISIFSVTWDLLVTLFSSLACKAPLNTYKVIAVHPEIVARELETERYAVAADRLIAQ